MTWHSYSAEVTTGIALLDSRMGTWWDDVPPELLDMADGSYCILGQLFGDYVEGRAALGMNDEDCIRHGFLLDEHDGDSPYDYQRLTAAWHAAITARTGEDQPS